MKWIDRPAERGITLDGIFRTLRLKLDVAALRAFPSSPWQKAIIEAREKLDRIAEHAKRAQ